MFSRDDLHSLKCHHHQENDMNSLIVATDILEKLILFSLVFRS